ncbi:tyrosine-type recombinase/integrase [Microbacterium paraoxydans]|uniref:tyrosine-type recombinase/integrase n=1 Tax=Microbacterium paraoxydans TaxID=199592 RepID=UPI003AF9503A
MRSRQAFEESSCRGSGVEAAPGEVLDTRGASGDRDRSKTAAAGWDDGKEPEDRLLVGPKGGALTTATVRDATNWDQIVSDLGLPDLTRHGLRHTGATWMADAGIPLHVLQDILGHASVETARGYLHPDDRHLASAAEQANAFLARSAKASRPSRREASRSL